MIMKIDYCFSSWSCLKTFSDLIHYHDSWFLAILAISASKVINGLQFLRMLIINLLALFRCKISWKSFHLFLPPPQSQNFLSQDCCFMARYLFQSILRDFRDRKNHFSLQLLLPVVVTNHWYAAQQSIFSLWENCYLFCFSSDPWFVASARPLCFRLIRRVTF